MQEEKLKHQQMKERYGAFNQYNSSSMVHIEVYKSVSNNSP